MKNLKPIFSALLCAFFILAGSNGPGLFGDIKFREFSRDRDVFERYTAEAGKSTSAEDWQRIVDSGREEMMALWERNALAECDRYIREGFDPGEVRTVMEEARAGWENEFDSTMFFERGRWRAAEGATGYTAGNMDGLQERVADAGNAGLTDVEAWNNYVSGALQATESSWESTYATQVEMLYGRAGSLEGMEKEGFLAEAERIESDLRERFDVEKDTIIYLGKSGFIEQIESGSRTLREESESSSAVVITDNIIADTESEIRDEEVKILNKTYSPESGSSIDFTGLGENWQEDLKRLIDFGMSKWEAARQRLYNDIISWKKTAEDAYIAAEGEWRKGLIKLEAARLEWERKLSQEIYSGLDKWEDGNDDLNDNIVLSRKDFTSYIQSMSVQWSDSNRDLVEMAVNGSAVYADAVENINWLNGMIESTADEYAFSRYDDKFKNAIGTDIVNNIETVINDATPLFSGQYGDNSDYSQSFEVIVSQAEKPGYNGELNNFTECYTISVVEHVYQKFEHTGENIYIDDYTIENKNTLLTINWNNVVTADSAPERRTANCYYAFELARWERIRTAFSTISGDAEFYMHERNMDGANGGAGYLTNASGRYTTNADGSTDPYLMTGAEYSLEFAEREMDFWQQRLYIARSVLDYAEGRTKETAADTERHMTEAKTAITNAKGAYDTALAAVNNILADMRNIQGLEPLTDDPEAWRRYNESYNSSIENLAGEYKQAETALRAAEEEYSKAKAALVIYQNLTGEDDGFKTSDYFTRLNFSITGHSFTSADDKDKPAEYLKNEIIELERRITLAEQEINEQREKLFIKQNESDFTARTKQFAGVYAETVKKYEESKDKVDLFRGIITGPEHEADVSAWCAAIYQNRQALWGDAADEFFAVLNAAVTAYNSSPDTDRAAMRDNVLLEIRQIYLSLSADVDIYRKSIEMLRDENFNPEIFADSEYIADHNVYAEYARYSAEAIDIIEHYFNDADDDPVENRSYERAWGFLKAGLDNQRFVYGEDNRSYIIHYTALKYFEERYKGLNADTWGACRQRLAAESDYAENAVEIHEEMSDGENAGTLAEMEGRASEGDIDAVQYLREYYAAGSAIPGLAYIKEYDASADIADYVNEALKNFAVENSQYFFYKEQLQEGHNYIDHLYGLITSAVTTGSAPGEYAGIETFRNMQPEEISEAAGMLLEYVAELEKSGFPVPESIRTAASAITGIKEDLDTELFIMRYMNNLVSGSPDEILAAAGERLEAAETAYSFLQLCNESIEYGTSYNAIAMGIKGYYENLTESQKLEIDGNETAGDSRVSDFIANLYSYIYMQRLAEHENTYIMNMAHIAPADYAAALPPEVRQQFINDTTPVYERMLYDLAVEEGRAATVDGYISTRAGAGEIDDETAESLRNYALIKKYIEGTDKGEFSGQPVEVKVYLAQKYYYDMVFSGNADSGDIETLLEERFGSENIDGDIIEKVEEYAGRLNAVIFYNGNVDDYIETLSPGAAEFFQMYVYGEESAILPGYEYGIYGEESAAGGKLAVSGGMIEREIEKFRAGYDLRIIAAEEYREAALKEQRRAEALDSFVRTGVQGKNWRDSAVTVKETEKEEAEDGSVTVNTTTVIEAVPVTDSGYIDGYDEDDKKISVKFSQNPACRGVLKYSMNGIIDNVNRIASIFSALGESYKAAAPAVNTITAFLEKADLAYNCMSDCTAVDGKYGFESELDSYVSGADSADFIARSEEDGLNSGLFLMEKTLLSDKKSVTGKSEIIESLGDKDEEELLAEIEAAQRVHEQMEAEYQEAKSNIELAQERYRLANERYTDAMENISRTYNQYKAAEVEFERTSSIYEYANTPYLKESSTLDSGLGNAVTVDGSGNTDYGELPVPDARENYERILARYNEKEEEYRTKQKDVDNQETIKALNTNTDAEQEYADFKSNFVRKSESYIRICHADTVLNEYIDACKSDYDLKESEYKSSRDNLPFFSDLAGETGDDKDRLEEFELARDRVLSHIKNEDDVIKYAEAIELYSCWTDRMRESFVNEDHRYQAAINQSADKYASLDDQTRKDIEDLYAVFGTSATLTAIKDNYKYFVNAQYMEEDYRRRKNDTNKYKHPKRWKNNKEGQESWGDTRKGYELKYWSYSKKISDSLKDFVEAKNQFLPVYGTYNNAVSMKTLDDVKRYLGAANGYNLTDEELKYLYDSTTAVVDFEGVNAGSLRKEVQRRDIDGAFVKARYFEVNVGGQIRGKVVVLNKDGSDSTEIYNVTDAWIKVRLGGEEPISFTVNAVYDFYDNNYDIRAVSGLIRSEASEYRSTYMTALMGYVQDSARAGTHDYTVMLRDLEDTYNNLKNTAVAFNSTSEIRQRSFEGYNTVMSEFAWNQNGSSVQQMIMKEYIRQNTLYQEQQWDHQKQKYEERRDRWEEVTGYILNRGMRDWRLKGNEYLQKWRKWRIETEKNIEAGRQWWADRDIEMRQEMKTWGDDAGKAANKEAAQKIYADLDTTVDGYEKQIRKSMPGVSGITVDTDGILNNTLKNIPVGTLGVLQSTMFNTDRVAGMAEIFGFGNNAALVAKNREWQQEYEDAFSVMRNLQVLDVLNGIIDNFNKQLAGANSSVYKSVEYDLRYSEAYGQADFVRNENENLWTIRVCVESNLTGDKFKTRKFRDYVNMPNSTVLLKPIKGIDSEIDFTRPDTYAQIDSSELEVYVGLESSRLNDEIENVFEDEGLFSDYTEGEFDRLNKEFAEYYGQWVAGEALLDAGFYAKPMFPNGPNMLTTAAIAVSFTGNPWIAFAVNSAVTGLQVADGTITGKQAMFNMGISAATAAIGVGAERLGGAVGSLVGETSQGLGKATMLATQYSVTTAGNTLLSGMSYDPAKGFDWDEKRMSGGETWAGAGLTAAAGAFAAGYVSSDLMKAVINGSAGGINSGWETGDWQGAMTDSLRSSAAGYITQMAGVQSGVMSNASNLLLRNLMGSGEGLNWGTVANTDAVGALVARYTNEFFMTSEEKLARAMEANRKQSEKDPFEDLDIALSGIFLSKNEGTGSIIDRIKADFGKAGGDFTGFHDGIVSAANMAWDGVATGMDLAWDGVISFSEHTGNLFSEGQFASDDDIQRKRILEVQSSAGINPEGEGLAGKTVRSVYREGTNADKLVKRIVADRTANGEDVTEEMVRSDLMEANGLDVNDENSWNEMKKKFKAGGEIFENERTSITRNVDKKYDKEYAEREAADKQNNRQQNPDYLSYELDYNTAGPNWGGNFSFSSLFSGDDNSQINTYSYSFDGLDQRKNGSLSQMLVNEFEYNQSDANNFAKNACVANSTYIMLLMSGAPVGTSEEFYQKHMDNGDINPSTANVNRYTEEIVKDYGFEQITLNTENPYEAINDVDFDYGKATFKKWSDQKQKEIEHTVAINKGQDGKVSILADTGADGYRTTGKLYTEVFRSDKLVRFQYLKKRR